MNVWQWLPSVRPNERKRFLFFVSLSALITLAQTVGLVGAESLLLARFGAEILPQTFIAASALTVFGSLLYALGVDRSRNDTYFILILLIMAVLVTATSYAAVLGHLWALPLLYCLFYLNLAVGTNHYWTFTGDYFDTLAAKRLFPLFVVGSSVGGLVGGALSTLLASGPQGDIILLAAWIASLIGAAVWLRWHRRSLRRWGPLELEEADETSLDGMQASVRYLRQSALGRWLVASALLMVLALFISQYLYSDVLAKSFPDAAKLASFLGLFLAFTNFIEILIEVVITPKLISKMGVASANLVHPALTVLSFAMLAVSYTLPPALIARANRETVENALSGPIRNLVYNALPARFRGRMRAFLEGIVVYSGMVFAGIALLLLAEHLNPFWVCVSGGATAAVYLLANFKVRQEYMKTLVTELQAGRLNLDELGQDLGALEIHRLAELWKTLLADKDSGRFALPLVETLAQRGIHKPLAMAMTHADPRLRRACLVNLAQFGGATTDVMQKGLKDEDPQVRLAAISGYPEDDEELFASLLDDSDPRVRAHACLKAGKKGLETLQKMANAEKVEEVVAALAVLPASEQRLAQERAQHADFRIRAAALETCARHRASYQLEELEEHLACSDYRVRKAAIALVGQLAATEPRALNFTAKGLADSHRGVRQLAAELLSGIPSGLEVVEPYLKADDVHTVESAAEAVGALGSEEARELLSSELRQRVRQAWTDLISLHLLQADHPDKDYRFLQLALENAVRRNRICSFRLLEALEGCRIIRSVEKVLRFANARVRADALEVLSNLGDREASSLLVLMLEEGAIEDKLPSLRGQIEAPEHLDGVLSEVQQRSDRWLRMAVEGADKGSGETGAPEEIMEHLLVLRRVPLFGQMTLEQLEAISRLLSEEHYLKDEMVFREGDVGDELYIIVEGEVEIWRADGTPDAILLATLSEGSYFGEMAILDDEPRSAGVRCATDTRLLRLKGEQLKELVFQMPEIAFEIFKVLTGRIRKSDARLEEVARMTNTAEKSAS